MITLHPDQAGRDCDNVSRPAEMPPRLVVQCSETLRGVADLMAVPVNGDRKPFPVVQTIAAEDQ